MIQATEIIELGDFTVGLFDDGSLTVALTDRSGTLLIKPNSCNSLHIIANRPKPQPKQEQEQEQEQRREDWRDPLASPSPF